MIFFSLQIIKHLTQIYLNSKQSDENLQQNPILQSDGIAKFRHCTDMIFLLLFCIFLLILVSKIFIIS